MEDQAAAAAKKRSPWRQVVVPLVVALIVATFGQFAATAAKNLKPRVAAKAQFLGATYRTSRLAAPDLTRASLGPGPKSASVYSYDAYGTEGPFVTGTNPNPYGFAGERTDPFGLQWLRARWYAPEQGRFLSRDTASSALDYTGISRLAQKSTVSFHPYGYGDLSPATNTDPSGQQAVGVADPVVATKAQSELKTSEATSAQYVYRWVLEQLAKNELLRLTTDVYLSTRRSGRPSVCIGETQTRVERYAPEHNCDTYKAVDMPVKAIRSTLNYIWIRNQLEAKKEIIDFGFDVDREGKLGDYYVLERDAIENYGCSRTNYEWAPKPGKEGTRDDFGAGPPVCGGAY